MDFPLAASRWARANKVRDQFEGRGVERPLRCLVGVDSVPEAVAVTGLWAPEESLLGLVGFAYRLIILRLSMVEGGRSTGMDGCRCYARFRTIMSGSRAKKFSLGVHPSWLRSRVET